MTPHPMYAHRDGSVIIPLSDPEHISHARAIIAEGRQPKELLVRVRAGNNGINRNYFDPQLKEWSWHVYEFYRFVNMVGEPLNTLPIRLETEVDWSDPMQWDETRPVGFGSLSLVRELGPHPLYLTARREGPNFKFYWSTFGTNRSSFTLETKVSATSTNWVPVAGLWPIQTNHWSIPLTSATDAFYRVRADLE